MTEQEWLTSTDPSAMLTHIQGKVSDRKLRLFACSCCRQVWDGVPCEWCQWQGIEIREGHDAVQAIIDWGKQKKNCRHCHGTGRTGPRSRRAVEVAERYADGEATEEELKQARISALHVEVQGHQLEANEAMAVVSESAFDAAHTIARPADAIPPAQKAALLREIAGNPFRPVSWEWQWHSIWSSPPKNPKPSFRWRPSWVRYPGIWESALHIAHDIYDERRWDDLPILWDALSEAGCTNETIRTHCLEKTHVRGCCVVDLILGKE